jgi:hypothetical protein
LIQAVNSCHILGICFNGWRTLQLLDGPIFCSSLGGHITIWVVAAR